jgi:hypothetical protein
VTISDDLLQRIRLLAGHEDSELAQLIEDLDAILSGGGPLPRPWSPEHIRAQLQAIANQIQAEFLGCTCPPDRLIGYFGHHAQCPARRGEESSSPDTPAPPPPRSPT